MNKILAVDVDLTVVDTGVSWYNWLCERAGYSPSLPAENIPYNISELFHKGNLNFDPYDYWRSRDVYDSLSPIRGCVEALEGASRNGWEVVFVSAIKGDHNKSKFNFLQKHFPFMSGYIATKEKGYVRATALIDDRNNFLNLMPKETMRIRYETPYTQSEELEFDGRKAVGWWFMDDWAHLGNILSLLESR